MKGAIAAFVAAVSEHLAGGRPHGSISLLITGDEEGDAVNGTRKVLRWLTERDETLDCCLVGEPTSDARPGAMVKHERPARTNPSPTVTGQQGPPAPPTT